MFKSLNKNYIKSASIGILAILLYFILSALESTPFALFGINMNTLPTYIKIIYSILFESVLMLIIIVLFKDKLKKDVEDLKKNHQTYFNQSIKYWIISLAVMMISNLIINAISGGIAGNEESVRTLFNISPIYIFFSAVIFAPIVEELIFRQAIRNIFKTDILFILISGFIFGALHVASNFTSWIDLFYIIPYSAPGLAFAYMLKKYDNIFVSMGFHFMHNGILIALQFLILLG